MNEKRPEKDTKTFNACLLGASLNTGNMGVSALAASLVALVLEARPGASVHFLIGNADAAPQELRTAKGTVSVDVVNFRLSPRAKLQEHLFWIVLLALLYRFVPLPFLKRLIVRKNRWLAVLLDADFVGDIRGGDSFSDIYGFNRFFMGVLPALTALIVKKDLVLLPQTYGPYRSARARLLARFVLARAPTIISRDEESIPLVEEILGGKAAGKRILFCPDVAFTLESSLPESIDAAPPIDFGTDRPLIGLNVNGLMYNGGYTRSNMFGLELDYREYVLGLLGRLARETDAHVLLVPHTFGRPGSINSDPDACRAVLESLPPAAKERVHLVTRQYDQYRIKGIIGLCDFFIGSRMHSCIAALSQGIPTAALAYSKKFLGVFGSAGLGDMVVDARSLDTAAALERTMACYENRARSKERLDERAAALRKTVAAVFADLLKGEGNPNVARRKDPIAAGCR